MTHEKAMVHRVSHFQEHRQSLKLVSTVAWFYRCMQDAEETRTINQAYAFDFVRFFKNTQIASQK